MNVQAFLNNVSFPKNLEELDYYKDEFDVETLNGQNGLHLNGRCRVTLCYFFTQKQPFNKSVD